MNKAIKMLCVSLAAVGLTACAEKPVEEVLRPEFITAYETSPDVPVSDIQVSFAGVQDAEVHILSNLPELEWRYQVDQTMADPQWLTIKSVDKLEEGHWMVRYDAKSILERNTIARRESQLSFSNAESYMGKFILFRQGYSQIFSDDFTGIGDDCVMLSGKQTYATDTLHVINTSYYNYVSFNAYASKKNDFSLDNVTLNVTVAGGPVFKDINRTEYTVNVPVGNAPVASNMHFLLMWNKGNVMGSKTTLTFSVDNPDGTDVYIDNLQIYKVSEAELDNFADDEYEDEMEEWE